MKFTLNVLQIIKNTVLFCLFFLAAAVTYAGGYRTSLQGQRALAMGHTGVAVVNNAELAFFNPAGLVYLEDKINIAAGANAIFSNVVWQNEEFGEMYRTESPVGNPFYVYVSYKISEKFSLGLAVYTPYGSKVEWPADWAGSHLVNTIDLQAVYVQALVSYKISNKLSLGGGPIYVKGGVNYNRNLNRSLTDLEGNRANFMVDARGVSAFGWSAGAMFNLTERLRLGVNYRSEIIMDAEGGEAVFENVPESPLTPFEDTYFDASLPLPAELSLGLSYQLLDKWLLAADYNRTYWGVYESLDLKFASPNIPDSQNPRNYRNSSTYRVGMEYLANEMFNLRVGYYFEESPVPSGYFAPETPRNDSYGFTGGLTVHVTDNFAVDAAFLFNRYEEIEESYDFYEEDGKQVPFRGTYKTTAFIPGVGVSFKL